MSPEESGSNIPPDAIEALKQGNKIEAIKLTRETTGMSLKDAKDAVEKLITSDADIGAAYKAAAPRGNGCLPIIIVLLIALAALAYCFYGDEAEAGSGAVQRPSTVLTNAPGR